MHLVNVGLGEFEIDADGFEGGMSEHGLEGVDVTAVAEVLNGEGMAEAVGMNVGDACAFADGLKHSREFCASHRAVEFGEEERVTRQGVLAGGEVAPDHLSRAGGEGEQAFLHPFALVNKDTVVAVVEVFHVQVAEFGGADAGVEQEQEDGAFALEGAEGVIGVASMADVDFGAVEG